MKTRNHRGKPSPAGGNGLARGGRRKNPRILSALLAHRPSLRDAFFESAKPLELVQIFEESYPWDLVNLLLDLKKSSARRIFEIVIRERKRAFLHIITLYYYKEYLMMNPFRTTLTSETGRLLPNHYASLGVPREASLDDLKEAQKLLDSSLLPDCFAPADRKLGEDRRRELNRAFEMLLDPKRRKHLDGLLPSLNHFYPRREQSWVTAVHRLIE